MSWRPPQRIDHQLAWLWCTAAASLLALAPLLVMVSPFFPRCPFHSITGVPCPACGASRAGLALLSGHPLGALAFNPLATLAGLAFLLGGLTGPFYLLLGGRLPGAMSPLPRWARLGRVLVILLNWTWLIAHGV